MSIEEHKREAYALGVGAAKAQASWLVDGNTKREAIPAVLAMFDAGDPAVDDYLPATPNLSGEWADDLTPVGLYERVTGESHSQAEAQAGLAYETLVGSVLDAIADAWEQGVSDTFLPECERVLREAIA